MSICVACDYFFDEADPLPRCKCRQGITAESLSLGTLPDAPQPEDLSEHTCRLCRTTFKKVRESGQYHSNCLCGRGIE